MSDFEEAFGFTPNTPPQVKPELLPPGNPLLSSWESQQEQRSLDAQLKDSRKKLAAQVNQTRNQNPQNTLSFQDQKSLELYKSRLNDPQFKKDKEWLKNEIRKIEAKQSGNVFVDKKKPGLNLSLPTDYSSAQKNPSHQDILKKLNHQISTTQNQAEKLRISQMRNKVVDYQKKGWSLPEEITQYYFSSHDPKGTRNLNEVHTSKEIRSYKELSDGTTMYIGNAKYNNSFNNPEEMLYWGIQQDIFKNNKTTLFVAGEFGIALDKEIGYYRFKIRPDGSIYDITPDGKFSKTVPAVHFKMGIEHKIQKNIKFDFSVGYTPSVTMSQYFDSPRVNSANAGISVRFK